MRSNKALVITALTVLSLVLFSFAKPVLSYQAGQTSQVVNQPSSSVTPGLLIAAQGCNGANRARDSLQSALDALQDVRDEGIHLRRASQYTRSALAEIRQHLAQRRC